MRDIISKNLRTGKITVGTFLGNPENPPQYGRRDKLKIPLARKIVRRENILSRNFLLRRKSLHNIGGGEIPTVGSPPNQESEYRYCSHNFVPSSFSFRCREMTNPFSNQFSKTNIQISPCGGKDGDDDGRREYTVRKSEYEIYVERKRGN